MFRKILVTPQDDSVPSSKNKCKSDKSTKPVKKEELKRCLTTDEIKSLSIILVKLATKECFNEEGNIITPNGEIIRGSNIIDILLHAIKPERYVEGFEFLPDILKKAGVDNIPNKLILLENNSSYKNLNENQYMSDDYVMTSEPEKTNESITSGAEKEIAEETIASRQKSNPRKRKKNWILT